MRKVKIDLKDIGYKSDGVYTSTIYLADRYRRKKGDMEWSNSALEYDITLEPNSSSTLYVLEVQKESRLLGVHYFYVFDGEGDISILDALVRFDFECCEFYLYDYKDKSRRVKIDDDFVKSFDSFCVDTKKFFTKEFKKAIDVYARYADENMKSNSGDFVKSEIIEKMDFELAQIGIEE